MPPFAHAKISGGAIINHNSNNNNGPFPSASDDNDDAFEGAVITGGIINHGNVNPHILLALIDQNRNHNQPQRFLSRQIQALLAAIKSLEDSVATEHKERASSNPGATTTPDDSEVVRLKKVLDTLAVRFATLFAKDRDQIHSICSSITGK